MDYFRNVPAASKFKIFLLALFSLGLIFSTLFIFKKSPSVASTSYYESLKLSPSSLNANTIWGNGESFDSIVAAGGLDNWAAFYSATNHATGGLDPSGYLAIDGVPYNFTWTGSEAFSGNDAIRLDSTYTSSRILLDTIGAYEKLYVLGTAGGPGEGNYANFAVKVNYTDGSFDETDYRLYDWYDPTPVSGVYKYPGLARRVIVKSSTSSSRPGSSSSSNNGYNYEGSNTAAPYLQSATISVDSKKLVSSIDLVLTGRNDNADVSGIYCGIYAITGMVNIAAPNAVENIYVDSVSETTADIHWSSVANATNYRLDIALDPDFKNILPNYNNLYVRDISLVATGLSGDTTYYTRVRAENNDGQSISSNYAQFTTDHETIPPVLSISANPTLIQISDTLIVSATDASGVQSIEESLDSGASWSLLSQSDSASLEITDNGTYCFRASDVYDNLSEPECLTYVNIDTAKPLIAIDSNGYTLGTWTNQPVTLTVIPLSSNVGETKYYYSLDGTTWLDYTDAFVFNGETPVEGQTISFKAISAAGVESDPVSALVKKDSTPPTGEISGVEKSWNEFINTITFGLFANRTVEFTLEPHDELSGLASVEYLVTKEIFATEADAIAASGWTQLTGPVEIQPEKDFILYYKLSDQAGNIKVLNTNGIVLDTTKALIQGYVSPGNTYDLVDGQTYFLTHKLLITDNKAIASVTINGQTIDLPESNLIELSGNADNVFNIVVTDVASNVTTLTLKTSALSQLNLGINADNFRTDDHSRITETLTTLQGLEASEGAHATNEELAAITELTDLYEDLLDRINSLEAELAQLTEAINQLPTLDSVTSASRTELEQLAQQIDTLFSENQIHLTIDEQNTLFVQQQAVATELARLDEVKNAQDSLEIVYLTDLIAIKTSDETELRELLATAEALIASNNETPDERAKTLEERQIIQDLLARVEAAQAAEATESILSAEAILPSNFTMDDQALLEAARDDIISAIADYGSNYTEAERERLDSLLSEIELALSQIAAEREAEIHRTTFPSLTLSGETNSWRASDELQINASDDYGIAKLEVSDDNGLNWQTIGETAVAQLPILKNATYRVRATNLFDNSTEQTITYTNIDNLAPVVEINSYGYSSGTWTNQPVSLSASNVAANLSPVQLYSRVATLATDGDFDSGLEFSEWAPYTSGQIIIETADTSSKIYEFYAQSAAGLVSDIVSLELKKDAVAPVGTVSSGTNSWHSLLNAATFGLFFDDTMEFSLTATDDRSGLALAEYLLSEQALTGEELLATNAWQTTTSGSISVDPERDFFVYYRLTDRASNRSFLSTDGIILDVTPPLIQGYLNGTTYELETDKTYYLTQKILVTDNKALASLSLDGAELTPDADGLITIPGNTDFEHQLVAVDRAGNITHLSLKTAQIAELSDLDHFTINEVTLLNQEIQTLETIGAENPAAVEQNLINGLISDYQDTLAEIAETETKFNAIISQAAELPATESVTEDDLAQIQDLLIAIEDILTNNVNHLTEPEKQILADLRDDLQIKLAEINDFIEAKAKLADEVGSYSLNTVNSDDKTDLLELRDALTELALSTHATTDDQTDLAQLIKTVDELLAKIQQVEEALASAKERDSVPEINPDNVTIEDQTKLEDAAIGYAEALGVFDSNLSPAELLGATSRIAIIGSSLDILDQVAEFEALISRLPEPSQVDYSTRPLINDAEKAYNALSEYARTLVGPSLLSKYRAVLEAYRAYLAGSPLLYAFETLDVFWWGICSFFIATTFFFVVSRTHKRYAAIDSDKF